MKLPCLDTLFMRMFVLMWAALIVSHLLAFGVVTQWLLPTFMPESSQGHGLRPHKPIVFPSLPPMSGLSGHTEHEPHHPPPLPLSALALDYAVRLVVLALASWYGARWLVVPVRRLTLAASQLVPTLAKGQAPKVLDASSGTLEVRETARVFNQLSQQLQEEFRRRELVLAAVSHDLRTPLTRMRLHLEPGHGKPDVDSCISVIREMDGLIGSVLELFRHQGTLVPLQRTDINALAQSVVDDLCVIDPRVVMQDDGNTSHIALADPAMLRRVMINVIHNALRYGGHEPVLVRVAEAEAQKVAITIDDRGPGIDAAHLERVFEPFVRVPNGNGPHAFGSGLGLYIARDLMQRQNGAISLTNLPSGGLRAQIWLSGAEGSSANVCG